MNAHPAAINLRHARLGGLQSLRAIAALAVCLQHAIHYSSLTLGQDPMPFLRIGMGGAGVNLFFVISGFVMAGCLYQGRRFLWNRLERIYPGYWLAIALSGLLLMAPQFGWRFDLPSVFLVPQALNTTYHIPYWTLAYEVGFYVLVAALIALRCTTQAMSTFCVLWLLAIMVVSRYAEISIAQPGVWLWLAPHNIFFITGFLLGLHYRHLEHLPCLPLGLIAVVCCSFGEILYGVSPAGAFLLYGPGLAAVLMLGVRHVQIPWLERMGDASYGIYLLHAPIMVLCLPLLQSLLPDGAFYPLMLACLLIAVTGSTLFGAIEFRMHRAIKKRTSARAPA